MMTTTQIITQTFPPPPHIVESCHVARFEEVATQAVKRMVQLLLREAPKIALQRLFSL